MDDELELEEVFFIDTDETASFCDLSIPQLMALVSKLVPFDNDEEMEIITQWLLPDFQLYESMTYYDPEKWEAIALFTRSLLLKRAFKHLAKAKL